MQNLNANIKRLPSFQNINYDKIKQELMDLLQKNLQRINYILLEKPNTWESLLPELMLIDNKLNCFWSPIQHLHGVLNKEALRVTYEECLPLLSEYSTDLGQNIELQQAFYRISTSTTFDSLNYAQKKVIKDALRDFHLSGVDLPAPKKRRFREICTELAKLTTQFENNLLDSTQNWQKHIIDETQLAGIPDLAKQGAAELAATKNLNGWLLTLDFPCYLAVLSYANDPQLREEIYTAYVTRASELSPNPDWDNSSLMFEILKLRDEKAKLLGFTNYTEYSLATKMVESPQHVIEFLERLLLHCKPHAKCDYDTLCDFARKQFGIKALNPWDITYYSEKLREEKYNISQEKLRPYFPIEQVLKGFFTILQKLYGISVEPINDVDTWHEDVRCYEIYDEKQTLRGICYVDLYARQHKRSGAWMADYCQRFRLQDGSVQIPVAFITCNFMPPTTDHPALLTHDDVVTLFHEFGHGLHHMLTTIDYSDISGISGVPWDAVELPSQFMENWCWQHDAIPLISKHYETGEPLPDAELQQLIDAKNFHAGLAMVRQIEFALFDMQIHAEFDAKKGDCIQSILNTIRQQASVIPVAEFNRFQHSFAHIFAGGYAAGYYSYLWAEVLSSDAFAKFEETGIFNSTTGQEFLTEILQQGGSKEPLELFVAFRGREPKIEALLRHCGFNQSV